MAQNAENKNKENQTSNYSGFIKGVGRGSRVKITSQVHESPSYEFCAIDCLSIANHVLQIYPVEIRHIEITH